MAQLISEIWEGLRSAGFPEVMLYLPDQSASRCHWKDTTLIGDVRVALLADQDRQIVRILPIDSCIGIGIASPKGVDPSGYKTNVHKKLRERFGTAGEADADADAEAEVEEATEEAVPEGPPPAVAALPPVEPAPPAPVPAGPSLPEPEAKADPTASRWGMATRAPRRPEAGQGVSTSGSFIPLRKF